MTNNNNQNEIWADVPGFENAYQVSNLGNVRSKDRFMNMHFIEGQAIKAFPMKKTGYYAFNCHAGIDKTFLLGRMVGLLFVAKPDGWDETWHITNINRDKSDCRAENLMWVSAPLHEQTAVVQLTKLGEFVAEYESIIEAGKQTGIWSTNISSAADPKRTGNKTAGGFRWMRAKDYYKN